MRLSSLDNKKNSRSNFSSSKNEKKKKKTLKKFIIFLRMELSSPKHTKL